MWSSLGDATVGTMSNEVSKIKEQIKNSITIIEALENICQNNNFSFKVLEKNNLLVNKKGCLVDFRFDIFETKPLKVSSSRIFQLLSHNVQEIQIPVEDDKRVSIFLLGEVIELESGDSVQFHAIRHNQISKDKSKFADVMIVKAYCFNNMRSCFPFKGGVLVNNYKPGSKPNQEYYYFKCILDRSQEIGKVLNGFRKLHSTFSLFPLVFPGIIYTLALLFILFESPSILEFLNFLFALLIPAALLVAILSIPVQFIILPILYNVAKVSTDNGKIPYLSYIENLKNEFESNFSSEYWYKDLILIVEVE